MKETTKNWYFNIYGCDKYNRSKNQIKLKTFEREEKYKNYILKKEK